MKSRSRLRLGQLSSPRLSSPKIISSPKEDGQRTGYAQVAEDDVPKKKKSSIFGVARLIRISSVSVFTLFLFNMYLLGVIHIPEQPFVPICCIVGEVQVKGEVR
jgi:hypothetical protein